MSEVVDTALSSKPLSLQTAKNLLSKLQSYIEQQSVDFFPLRFVQKSDPSKKAGCLVFEAKCDVCDIVKGIENEDINSTPNEEAGINDPSEKEEKEEVKLDVEIKITEQPEESNEENIVNDANIDKSEKSDDKDKAKEDEGGSKIATEEKKKPALKKVNKFKEPGFGKKKAKPELDWMKKKKGIRVNPPKKAEEDDSAEGTAAATLVNTIKIEVEETPEKKLKENPKENPEKKTEEKTEEKPEDKTKEKPEEKTEEKTEEQLKQNPEEKSEEKTEEKTEEQPEENPEEKSEEKTKEKTEEQSEEKSEEKIEDDAIETEAKNEEIIKDQNKDSEEDKDEKEKRRRLSSHLDNLEQQGNLASSAVSVETIQEENDENQNDTKNTSEPKKNENIKIQFYEMPKIKYQESEDRWSDDDDGLVDEDLKKEKQYKHHVRVSEELKELDEELDEETFERNIDYAYNEVFNNYIDSPKVSDAGRDYINQGKSYHARKARKLRLSRLKEENASDGLLDVLESIRFRTSLVHGKQDRIMSRYRTSSSSSITSMTSISSF